MLGVMESIILIASVYAGVELRIALYGPGAESLGPLLLRGVVYALVVIVCMIAMGLYHARVKPRLLGIAVRLVAGFALSGVGLALLFYVFPGMYIGRGALALAFLVSIILIIAMRALFYAYIDENVFRRRVLIYGTGEKAASILRLGQRMDKGGFRIIGCVSSANEVRKVDPRLCVELGNSLPEFVREQNIDEIVVAIDDRRRGLPVHELLECKLDGIDVTDALTFFERATGMVKLDLLYPSWMIFSDGFNNSALRYWSGWLLDISFSLLLLAVTWPIMLICAIAIKVEDGLTAPVFYRQKRVGYKGLHFNVLKFRSMKVDAEADGVAKWAEENDSRITKVGSIARKYRIDELPQIFNVLRGDMSFVGPRPERPDFVDELGQRIPYYRERHCVKPGITGWAQVCYEYGASQEDALEKLQYDLYYVKNQSLLFDIAIMLQTAEVILWKSGAR